MNTWCAADSLCTCIFIYHQSKQKKQQLIYILRPQSGITSMQTFWSALCAMTKEAFGQIKFNVNINFKDKKYNWIENLL